MADVACGQCGHRNPAGANFCSSCGSALDGWVDDRTTTFVAPVEDPAPPPEVDIAVALDDLATGTGMLVIRRGPGAGSRFLLDEDLVTAGRHPESHVFLDDVTVSRRHAEVIRSPGGYRVRDVESLNGTYVNRTRIDGDVDLRDGDELQIGRFKLVFLVAP
ncbi:MAG: FHA domain-containing protein [Acidimicrobiia bacterium]